MSACPEVAIVGAGPYGLSIAAHLRARGIDFRVFGRPMQTWREQMPKGMLLKSDGFASSLSDPGSTFTLKQFCVQEGISYDDTREPVRLETFTNYGLAFQERMVPELEDRFVVSIDRTPGGFRIGLDDSEIVTAGRVLLAVGISHFQYIPPELTQLPSEFLSHSSAHYDLEPFRGREVTVIGGGASAIDLAGLLHEGGAKVNVFARRSSIRFHNPPSGKPRSLLQRARHPSSGIGPGWRSRFFTDAPVLFHYLPQDLRLRLVRDHLGPAPGWFMRDRVVGQIPLNVGHTPLGAEIRDGKVRLTFKAHDGTEREHITDHVIAATGYRVDLSRLGFLGDDLRSQIRSVKQTPILSSEFQSSVPGLYFLGPASANSFGPLMRFAFGAEFAARRVSKHLARTMAQHGARREAAITS
jgi:thioredoxin reductase